MGYSTDSDHLEAMHRAFDELTAHIKLMSYEHSAPTLITAVSIESLSRLEDVLCIVWMSLTERQKEGLLTQLLTYADGVRRSQHSTFPEEQLTRRMATFYGTAHALIESNQSNVTDYLAMIDDAIDLSRFRYIPKPPPEIA